MKFLVLTGRCPKNQLVGGNDLYVFEIFKRIAARGHQVIFLTSKEKNVPKREFFHNIEFIRLGGRYTHFLYCFLWYVFSRNKNFDFIIENLNGPPFFVPCNPKKKIVIVHHLIKNIFFKEMFFFLAFFGWILERILPFFYKKAKFIAVSESTKKELIDFGIDKKNISVIYNGINLEKISNESKNKKPTILFFNRFKKYKRIDHFLKAMKLVQKEIPNVEIIIMGRGSNKDEANIKKMIDKLGIENVSVYRNVKEKLKEIILAKSWINVHTSLREGFGLNVVESALNAAPSIGYKVPGLVDTIKNKKTGILVENGNIKKLAEAIIFLIKNEKLRNKLGKNAKKYYLNKIKNELNWDISTRKFLNLFEK